MWTGGSTLPRGSQELSQDDTCRCTADSQPAVVWAIAPFAWSGSRVDLHICLALPLPCQVPTYIPFLEKRGVPMHRLEALGMSRKAAPDLSYGQVS